MLVPMKRVFEDHKIELFYEARFILGPTMLMKLSEVLQLRKPLDAKIAIKKTLIPDYKDDRRA
jgi:hypothetical protein